MVGPEELNQGETRRHSPHRYPHEIFNLDSARGVRAKVPIVYLQGRQPLSEFSPQKRQSVIADYRSHERPKDFLSEHPLWLVALDTPSGLQLVIIDGHHRARHGPEVGIRNFESIIFPLEYVAEKLGKAVADFTQELQAAIMETNDSFSRSWPAYKPGQTLTGMHNLDQLMSQVQEFNIQIYPAAV